MTSRNTTNNDNSEQADAFTLELASLIDKHNKTRQTIARLNAIYNHYKASPAKCDQVVKCLRQAVMVEKLARDELLVCPVQTVQQAATKAVHLRNALLQDETQNPRRFFDEHIEASKQP